jgi:hypothetical protein
MMKSFDFPLYDMIYRTAGSYHAMRMIKRGSTFMSGPNPSLRTTIGTSISLDAGLISV